MVVGGEFWILTAYSREPIIHCKRIANRNQVLLFDLDGSVSPPIEAWATPGLPRRQKVDGVSPFQMGREGIMLGID